MINSTSNSYEEPSISLQQINDHQNQVEEYLQMLVNAKKFVRDNSLEKLESSRKYAETI